jgi:hypothetical protein
MRDTERPGWSAADFMLAAASAVTFAYAWVYYPITRHHRGDFFALLSHRDEPSPYWDGHGIGYGPIFALYDLGLRPFHDLLAMRLMYLINLGLLAAAFVILLRVLLPAPRTRRETLWALFVWTSFYPLTQLVRQNNIEITELFFLSLFLLHTARRQPTRAGLALGLASSAKLVPIFLTPYLLWRRQWKTAAVGIGTLALMLTVVSAIKGLGPLAAIDNWRHAATVQWNNEWNNNQALSGFFWRLFSVARFDNELTAAYPQVLHADWARTATAVASLAAVAATAALLIRCQGIWPGPARDAAIEVSELGIVFTVLLLVLPHSHTHYFGLIVWIYFIALRALMRDEPRLTARAQWLWALSYLLAGLLLPLRLADPLVRARLPVSLIEIAKLFSLPLFGVILGVVALAALYRAQLSAKPS